MLLEFPSEVGVPTGNLTSLSGNRIMSPLEKSAVTTVILSLPILKFPILAIMAGPAEASTKVSSLPITSVI